MTQMQSTDELLRMSLGAIAALRRDGAVVHCITNTVAQNFTANVLLACGVTPSMTVSPEEVPFFSSRADAVLINLGTLDDQRIAAVRSSIEICQEQNKPFVLDPVMCHVSPPRLALAKEILELAPQIVRGNPLEFTALKDFIDLDRTVLAQTGRADEVSFGSTRVSVLNGHEYLSKVTAVGCAQGALMAALAAKCGDSLVGAIAALLWFGVAGETAAELSNGPGSFQVSLIDQLALISLKDIELKARLS